MWVAGIDYSTHAVDVVVVPVDGDAPPKWTRHVLMGLNAFDRSRYVDLRGKRWDDILAVGIEDPRGFNAGALYRVQGAILAQLPGDKLVHPLIPSQWRKLVGLPGNASKNMVAGHSEDVRLTPPNILRDHWPQDAHDAHCIALATRTLLEREQRDQPVKATT